MINESKIFEVGQVVIYTPPHAGGNKNHPDAENGVVSTVVDCQDGTQKVWVKYNMGDTGALTPIKNLHILY